MVLGIQLVGILFACAMIYFSYLHYKREEFGASEIGFWTVFWILFGYISLFPNSLSFIVENLSLVRTMDLFTIGGFLFLIALTFHNYTVVKKNQNRMESLVRKLAMKKK